MLILRGWSFLCSDYNYLKCDKSSRGKHAIDMTPSPRKCSLPFKRAVQPWASVLHPCPGRLTYCTIRPLHILTPTDMLVHTAGRVENSHMRREHPCPSSCSCTNSEFDVKHVESSVMQFVSSALKHAVWCIWAKPTWQAAPSGWSLTSHPINLWYQVSGMKIWLPQISYPECQMR